MKFWHILHIFLGVTFLSLSVDVTAQVTPQSPTADEPVSPEGLFPASVEPGLSDRAIPQIELPEEPFEVSPLERLNPNYYNTLFRAVPMQFRSQFDPSAFRPVLSYEPPIALRPRIHRKGLVEFYPWVGLSHTFDSNVNLTATNPIADLYTTPRFGGELQIGTPESAYLPFYDTILALRLQHEAYADLFTANPELSAVNQKLDIDGRIGRSDAIFRPFFYGSDITGYDLLTRDLTNRTRRIRLTPGINHEFKITPVTGWNHVVNYYRFHHTDPRYINLDTLRTRQELTYLFRPDFKGLLWSEYRTTRPSRGSDAREFFLGIGWIGKPDPRLFSEMRIGWDFLSLTPSTIGARRTNLSGLRFNGYTTWQWGPRFAFTLLYDRDYVFDEMVIDNNFVSTLLQTKLEFYLGESWYITPYFGFCINEHETSRDLSMTLRPEIEIAYAFPDQRRSNESRIYLKIGYLRSETLRGTNIPVEGTRISLGALYRF